MVFYAKFEAVEKLVSKSATCDQFAIVYILNLCGITLLQQRL